MNLGLWSEGLRCTHSFSLFLQETFYTILHTGRVSRTLSALLSTLDLSHMFNLIKSPQRARRANPLRRLEEPPVHHHNQTDNMTGSYPTTMDACQTPCCLMEPVPKSVWRTLFFFSSCVSIAAAFCLWHGTTFASWLPSWGFFQLPLNLVHPASLYVKEVDRKSDPVEFFKAVDSAVYQSLNGWMEVSEVPMLAGTEWLVPPTCLF